MATPAVATTTIPEPTKPIMNSTVTTVLDIDTDGPLFPASLISPEVISALPPDYTIRPLRRSDYNRGYLDVLRVLTTVGEISEDQWNQRYEWIRARNDEYYMLVICDGADRVVGTGSLIVERKFIHSLGMVGHIEDIAVEKGQQGKKLGLRIIQALDYVAAQVGCYKVSFGFIWMFSLVWTFADIGIEYSGLLRGQRGLLCQVRLQACWPGDGSLLLSLFSTVIHLSGSGHCRSWVWRLGHSGLLLGRAGGLTRLRHKTLGFALHSSIPDEG